MTTGPRVRIAPSPTGFFHVGTARTALYNWLFARQQGGTFILRVEDTDQERHVHEAIEAIERSLKWLGLDWDEGPYFQSERRSMYQGAIEQLINGDHVYFCDCTREAVVERTKGNATPGYDRFCRDRGLGPGPGRALRFKVPQDGGAITVTDVVRGNPVFAHASIEDFVVARGDGSPVFILANAFDDLDMGMTHVIRGDDHLSNTPKYLLLWEALKGGDLPVFAHLPMLVNERRQKLSKRRDKVFVGDFEDEGYLSNALVNYVALLGWSPGNDREFISLEEMVSLFRLEDVVPSPGFFDMKKLLHFNQHYIQELSVDEFVQRVDPWLPPEWDRALFVDVAPLVQERCHLLADAPGLVDFLFFAEPVINEQDWDTVMVRNATAVPILDGVIEAYESCAWESEELQRIAMDVGEVAGVGGRGKRALPLYVAITGKRTSAPVFQCMVVLGREKSLARLRAARERLAHG